MTKKTPSSLPKSLGGKAAMAGAAVGSAAVAAALLYASKRRERKANTPKAPPIDPPETD
jgi:hypothetical protein